jgi:hypothetical protein
MLAFTAIRRFATSCPLLGKRALTGFAMFLKSTKGDKALNELAIPKRGKELGKRWWALSDAERAAFVAKGKKCLVTFTPRAKRVKKCTRKPTAYSKFVKANYSKVASLPFKQRFAGIAKLWKAQQKK